MALSFLMPKLYSNTILSSLNARTSMRRDLAIASGDSGLGVRSTVRVSGTHAPTPTQIQLPDLDASRSMSSISLVMALAAQMQKPDLR